MIIAHNVSALNTYKSLGIAGNQADNSMEKLSSGYKINKAADDAAGLSISEKMRSQIRGLNQAATNAENGVSMIQTAEGALNEEHSILQRMRELAVQAATDTNATEDREALQSELNQLSNEINRIGATTEFNGMKILDGSKSVREIKTFTPGGGGTKAQAKFTFFDYEDEYPLMTGNTELNFDDLGAPVFASYGVWDVLSIDLVGSDVVVTMEQRVASDFTSLKNVPRFDLGEDATEVEFVVTKDGSATGSYDIEEIDDSVYFHVGANSNQVINTEFKDMRASAIGITFALTDAEYSALSDEEKTKITSNKAVNNGTNAENVEYGLNISTREGANNAIDVIDAAIKKVSNERSKYGAIQNRLEYTINNLNTTAENMTAAESTIRDVDMANEMMNYTKNNILQQAAQAMLVQANARPQQALQLLQ